MLPPFIIEQIRKREQDERAERDREQPRLDLPLPMRAPRRDPAASADSDDADRGVLVIDL